MNLAQMRGQVIEWLGLQDIPSYDEKDIVEDALYRGTLDLLTRTRLIVRCVELTTFADKGEYVLDQHLLTLVDVEDGYRRRLRRDESCDYGFVLIRADLLRIVPTPSEDGQVQVYAVTKPAKMDSDDDSPSDAMFGSIPEEFHDAIVTFALWRCADYADDTTTQNGEYYRTLYEGQDGRGGRLAQIKVLVNKRGTARAARRNVRLPGVSSSGAYT